MSADNNDKTASSGSSLPVVVMMALLAVGVAVKNAPLESARPPDAQLAKSAPSRQQNVEARLWQDPLAAVGNYREKLSESEMKSDLSKCIDSSSLNISDLDSQARPGPVTVLVVSGPGDSFEAGAEWRRRSRFAVISALGFHNYYPENSNALHYFCVKDFGVELKPLIVPYEWFERHGSRSKSKVLVLWLNEDRFATLRVNEHTSPDTNGLPNNLKSMLSMVRTAAGETPSAAANSSRFSFKLIGPTNSEILKKYLQDKPLQDKTQPSNIALEVFVPTATISNCDLVPSIKESRQDKIEQDETEQDKTARKKSSNCFWDSLHTLEELKHSPIVRAIGSDDVLAVALLWELWQRGDGKSKQRNQDDASFLSDCRNGIVLLSELDTPYGRSLSKDLKEKFEERFKKRCKGQPPIYEFTYLRGLDGVLPDIEKPGSNTSSKNDKDESEKTGNLRTQIDDAPKEHAEGRNQYDYLRRITREIKRLDNNNGFTRNGIRAIGIVGTDVYDKFLILQALRTQFKDKIFFTTDLDARYLHADQKAWTRNLVVASNFDLSLHPTLQGKTPPFRDSYQTATYLATLMALSSLSPKEWERKMQKWLRPQIFEIGRTEAVHLASPSKRDLDDWLTNVNSKGIVEPVNFTECDINDWEECTSIEPRRPNRGLQLPSSENLLKIITTILLGIFLIALTNRGAGEFGRKLFSSVHAVAWNARLAAIFGVGLVAIIFLILYTVKSPLEISLTHGSGEPFVWLEGVSVWPSLVIRFTGLVVLLILITVFVARMRHKALSIAGRFAFKIVRPKPWRPRFWGLHRSWNSAICRGPNIDFTSFDMNGNIRASSQQTEGGGLAVVALWRNYLCVTRWRHMWPWVAICTVLAFSCVYLIFQLLNDAPFFPHRGALVRAWNFPLVYFNALALWVTIFWVGYETRACTSFIHVLSNARPEWPIRLLKQQEERTGISRKYLGNYLAFKLIVRVTDRIYALIYLPFVLILFMVLSRNDLFDAMDFPPSLLLATGLALTYALYTVRLLYKSAGDARAKVLTYYKNLQLLLTKPKPKPQPDPNSIAKGKDESGEIGTGQGEAKVPAKDKAEKDKSEEISREQVEWLINDVEKTRKGVFAPPTQQPWLQALLLPFGGYGSVQLLEYLLNFFAFG